MLNSIRRRIDEFRNIQERYDHAAEKWARWLLNNLSDGDQKLLVDIIDGHVMLSELTESDWQVIDRISSDSEAASIYSRMSVLAGGSENETFAADLRGFNDEAFREFIAQLSERLKNVE